MSKMFPNVFHYSNEPNVRFSLQSFSTSVVSQKKMNKNYQPLIKLSQEQLEILDFLNHNNRVAVHGNAGSGKTLLAIEQANRLHQKGLNILLVSYKKSLTKYIQHRLGQRENLEIDDFSGLSKTIVQKAIDQDINFKQYENKKLLFNEILPTLLLGAIEKIDFRFDAIIVNEGHKINELWWLALKKLLKDPEQGNFYFFHDNCQKTVGKSWYPPLQEPPYCLLNQWPNYRILYDCSEELEQQNSV